MTGNNHLLQKVTFEIGLNSQEGAFEIQNRISSAFQSGILSELEKLFDKESDPYNVISIDKIEIELGRLDVSRLEEELASAVEEKMSDVLGTLHNEIRNSSSPRSSGTRSINIRFPLPGNANFQFDVNISESGLSQFEKFTHLLEHGILPVGGNSSLSRRLADLITPVLSDQADEFVKYLRRNVYNSNILKRLVLNCTKSQLQYLAAVLGCPFSGELPDLIENFSELLRVSKVAGSDFRKYGFISIGPTENQIWLAVLIHYTRREDHKAWNAANNINAQGILIVRLLLSESGVLEKVLSHLIAKNEGKSKPSVESVVPKLHPSVKGALDVIINSLPSAISGRVTGKQSQKNGVGKIDDADLSALMAQLQSLSPIIEGKSKERSGNNEPTVFDANQESFELPSQIDLGVYINNAGLIILAPYLKPFFSKVGLLEERNFRNPESAIKAAHLLQFLCGFDEENQKTEYGEHDLLFNKILCGINISDPIPESIIITDEEKAECTVLLQSILKNWSIMKNSSIQALQRTFFQKQGRLKQVGGDWDLLVERDSAVEILIDKLPWSISFAKLPWNDYNIHTQW